jgi:hypothetical protein
MLCAVSVVHAPTRPAMQVCDVLKPYHKATELLSGVRFVTASLVTSVASELWRSSEAAYNGLRRDRDPEGYATALAALLLRNITEVSDCRQI